MLPTDEHPEDRDYMHMYAVYDSKAEAFYAPFPAPTDALAVRWLKEMVASPDTVFGKHPEDFTLFAIGAWCAKAGDLTGYSPRAVTLALALTKKED